MVATALHGHKLRRGKLAGNRFSITLRNVDRSRQSEVDEQITRLGEHGVPNYFGTQRYGVRLSNHLIGRALLREDWDEVVGLTLGRPAHADTDPRVHRARELHDAGRLEEAAAEWPRHFAVERAMAVDPQMETSQAIIQAVYKLRAGSV